MSSPITILSTTRHSRGLLQLQFLQQYSEKSAPSASRSPSSSSPVVPSVFSANPSPRSKYLRSLHDRDSVIIKSATHPTQSDL
ncbi:hypothetical protein ZOSMA_149G00330 [Zostera marina]|uniref:Uncharacterized protein n=1 Tax=Zostera marina TaxID=29655 RepID=A0A0K9PWN5_ZOSMR|nr:hypothetical protein ZOSMA_149G00330 [Zostera marina]